MARTIQRVLKKRVDKWYGLNTAVKDITSLKDGYTPDSLNWITTDEQDAIVLRRGVFPLGALNNTAGKITGLGVGRMFDGTEIPFFSYGRKMFYYDSDSELNVEIGSDILPENQDGIDLYIKPYQNLAGSFVYVSSPFMEAIKIPAANPGSASNQGNQDNRGYMNFHQSRSFLWQNNNIANQKDYTSLYLSWFDKQLPDDYPSVTKEDVGNGDGSTKNFTGTLAQITAPRTAFYVTIAAAIDAGENISGITAAASAVVTVASHSLAVGDSVIIFGVLGMTQINLLQAFVTATTSTTITLDVDSTSFSAYSSGGKIYKTELLKDDRNGNLSSEDGGTGTINYATGAFDATFFNAPTSGTDIIADYFYENANDEGVLDFAASFDGDGVRVPGTGDTLRQFAGSGNLNVVVPLSNIFFGFHQLNTWQTSIPSDDGADGRLNLPYREQMGVPSIRGAYAGTKGIYFVDYHNQSAKPELRRLEVFTGGAAATNTVVPRLLSEILDLSVYSFTNGVVFQWGRYVLISGAQIRNGVVDNYNSRTIIYNTESKTFDLLDIPVNCLAEYLGTLICGDPLTNSVYTLFSGFDDNGSDINNFYTTKNDDLGWKGQKRVRRLFMEGLIQPNQKIRVSVSFDDGPFVPYFTIDGSGSYVNTAESIAVGTQTVGASVGGGGETIFASPFMVEFPINTPNFVYIRLKFEANAKDSPGEVVGGYAQINYYEFLDIRIKTNRAPSIRQG